MVVDHEEGEYNSAVTLVRGKFADADPRVRSAIAEMIDRWTKRYGKTKDCAEALIRWFIDVDEGERS